MSSCLKRTCRQVMTGLFLSCSLLPATSFAEYVLTDLGVGAKPTGISNNGVVVGIVEDVSGTGNPPQAFVYDSNGLTILENDASATAINQLGTVSGYLNATPDIAQLWQQGQALNSFSDFNQIIHANDINDHSDVVGTQLIDGLRRMFHYEEVSGTLHTLGTLGGAESWANSINNLGQITGASLDEDNNTLMFVYDAGNATTPYQNMRTLPGFWGSEGLNLNDNKDAVGYAFSESPQTRGTRAVLSPLANNLVNLGTLANDTDSIARDINNDKIIVGQSIRADGDARAFLYNITNTDVLVANTIPGLPDTIITGSTRGNGIERKNSRESTIWTQLNNGLVTKTIYIVAADPQNSNILFAGSEFGVYRSINGGENWIHLETSNKLLLQRTIYALHVSSFSSDLVLAGTDAGIFYSNDGGDHWQLITDQEEHLFGAYEFIEHSDTRPLMMYTGTSSGLFRMEITAHQDGDYEFTLGSQNGQADTALARPKNITDIAIPPDTQNELFVTMSGGGVASASLADGSFRWTQHNSGLGSTIVNNIVFDSKGTAFVGTQNGLFFSTNKGDSWQPADSFGNNRGVYTLATATDGTTDVLYATATDGSVLMSHSDDGATLGAEWTIITEGVDPPDVYVINSFNNTQNETEILLGASSGVYFRNTEKNTWAAADNTVKNIKISAITANPTTNPSTIWVGSPDQGVFKSENSGRTWTTHNEGLYHFTVRDLTVDYSASPETVYAATLGGVYRSDDSGLSWHEARAGLGGAPTFSIFLDDSAFPPQLYVGTDKGIFRSSDRGENWIPMQSGSDISITHISMNILTDPVTHAQTKTLYASGPSAGLYESTNNGLDWSPIATPAGVEVLSFDIDTSNNYFYFSSTDGVYQSTDQGLTWTSPDPEGGNTLHTFTVKVIGPSELYAGTQSKGILQSTDDGLTWNQLETGLSDATTNIRPLVDNIVGTTSVIGSSTETIDTKDLWLLRDAVAINSVGQIVGWGEYDHDQDPSTAAEVRGYMLSRETDGSISLPKANLQVTQTASPDVVKQYTPVSYTITVKNLGPEVATGVTVTDWLPVRGIYRYGAVQGDPNLPARECIKRNHTLRCDIGNLAPGGSAQIAISSEPLDPDIKILNVARAIANEHDPDMSNNTTSQESGTTQVDRCFIATAAYGSLLDPHVQTLRDFRDAYLMTNAVGRYLVTQYYHYSPPMAQAIGKHESLRLLTQAALTPVVFAIRYPWAAAGLVLVALLLWHRRQRHLSIRLTH